MAGPPSASPAGAAPPASQAHVIRVVNFELQLHGSGPVNMRALSGTWPGDRVHGNFEGHGVGPGPGRPWAAGQDRRMATSESVGGPGLQVVLSAHTGSGSPLFRPRPLLNLKPPQSVLTLPDFGQA